ncbi:conjugal transfer protein [Clostridium perfringens]|uniref:conjugal transfer protein n=1 Tax=Clostridium perfringens TaxID=1502 RepID=UPI000D70E975|nr:conjugal transfer protein [Clostridium perfringens]PWX55386.1 conjugal transfer protein [Clostridium perfringens]
MFRRNKENTKPKKEKKEKRSFFKKKKDLAAELNNEVNNTKKNNLVRIMPFRIARGFLWGLIVILCIRGIVSIFKGNQGDEIEKKNKKFLEQLEQESSLEVKAYSFAEDFSRDYFTRYPNSPQDFENRIKKYTTEQLAKEMNNGTYSEVFDASAFSFQKYSENQINVSVKARVRVYTPKAGQEEVPQDAWQYDTNLTDYYITIPIVYDKDLNMAVDDLPVMTAPQTLASFENKEFSGTTETNPDIVNKINDSLTQFFKAYYEQNQTQIDYFLVDGATILGTGQKFTLKNIERTSIYKIKDKEFLAIVNLNIDSYGSSLKQGFNVTVVQDGDKFLVKSLEPRTTNINLENINK